MIIILIFELINDLCQIKKKNYYWFWFEKIVITVCPVHENMLVFCDFNKV